MHDRVGNFPVNWVWMSAFSLKKKRILIEESKKELPLPDNFPKCHIIQSLEQECLAASLRFCQLSRAP